MPAAKICCVPSCGLDSEILHKFPNPDKDANRFKTWVYTVGGDIIGKDDAFIFKYRRVCHLHFESKYHTRSKMLSKNAVPTLNMSIKMGEMNRGPEIYCLGCLCSGDKHKIQEYRTKYYDHFMAIMNVASLKLCYLCRTMAQHAELFVWNVHRNQIILENYLEDSTLFSCIKPESKGPPPVALSFSITLTDSVQDNENHTNHIGDGPFAHTVANTEGVIQTELLNTPMIEKVFILRPEPNSVISDESTTVCHVEVKQEPDIDVHMEPKSEDDYDDSPNQTQQENIKKTDKKHVAYTHKQKERVICDHCNRSFSGKDALRKHLLYLHPEAVGAAAVGRVHRCPQCPAAFRLRSSLRAHAMTHSDHRPHYCVECDKRFKCEGTLRFHLKTSKRHVNKTDPDLPSCSHCHKRFLSARNRDRHIQVVHLQRKPHKCDTCGKGYRCKSLLQKHVLVAHEGHKPPRTFVCSYCDQAFTTRHVLRAHIRRHTGERPFQCTECDDTFTQSGALHHHQRLKHKRLSEKRATDKKQK